MRPSLTYFAVRGRAEPIRLLLTDLAIDHDDVRLTPREFQAMRSRTPFGQLPIWEEPGRMVAQTRVILHHIADGRLRGAADVDSRLHQGEAEAAIHELFERLVRVCWSRSFAEDRPMFVAHSLGRLLPALDRHLGAAPGTYWGGDEPAVADYRAWNLFDDLRPLAPEAVPAHPNLQRLYAAFAARPRIDDYVQNRRPATISLPHAAFGGSPDES